MHVSASLVTKDEFEFGARYLIEELDVNGVGNRWAAGSHQHFIYFNSVQGLVRRCVPDDAKAGVAVQAT